VNDLGGQFQAPKAEKGSNKQEDGEVEEQEGNGSWELAGDQSTFGVDGGIIHKGKVEGDPSTFAMHGSTS
jgi:hypothetical protein